MLAAADLATNHQLSIWDAVILSAGRAPQRVHRRGVGFVLVASSYSIPTGWFGTLEIDLGFLGAGFLAPVKPLGVALQLFRFRAFC